MSGNNSAPKDEWVRLNVGGKVFQTTKDTLSRYPDTFLARLVNGGLSSDKDESGAYLIDADPEHFGTILNYLRRGTVTLDASKVILGDLLREADFFNIEPLVIEIRKAMRKFNFNAPDQITAMTNRILAKMEDMSKKLSNLSSGSMTPSMGSMSVYLNTHHPPMTHRRSPPRCQSCNKIVSCCNDPKPQRQSLSSTNKGIMIQQGIPNPVMIMQQRMTQQGTPNPVMMMQQLNQGPMVCQNCNKIMNCCNNPQPKMFDPNKPSFCAALQHQDAKPPGFICTGRYGCNH